MEGNGIITVRVDDRLVHGQIAAFWTNTLSINRIIVANDGASDNETVRATLRMATPAGVNLSVITLQKAYDNISAGNYKDQRCLLIFKNPEDALWMHNAGLNFTELNVANMSGNVGLKVVIQSVNVSEENIASIKALDAKGVRIYWQMVPEKPQTDLMPMINKL